jgi:hypothetical protein
LMFAVQEGYVGIASLLEREAAALVIQKQWSECFYNPKYRVCRKRLREEFDNASNLLSC